MRHACPLAAVIVLTGLMQAAFLVQAQSTSQSATERVEQFSDAWDEAAWEQRSGRFPEGYMRADDDRGWETRMITLRELVRLGDDAVPVLLELLQADGTMQRIFAAQVLGYIASAESREALLTVADSDESATARLYAVDSLGMIGPAAADVDWEALLESESNGDVKKHIRYAIERDGAAVDPAIVESLTDWDPATINSATIGQPAPDFELQSAQGETIRLSDYRGEKAVVLVFVYGDT